MIRKGIRSHYAENGKPDALLTATAGKATAHSLSKTAHPFLKWVGGKRSILPELLKRMPDSYDAYHESFMGGGALFFALQPKEAHLSDVNTQLVMAFQGVRDRVEAVIKQLRVHQRLHSKKHFNQARISLATEKDPAALGALFIYINKTCFNGLYRVNRAGRFNVPMGTSKQTFSVDEENLKRCANALKCASIRAQSFEQTEIRKNHFYYMDPPYHRKYSGYHQSGFDDAEHARLASLCREIDRRGGYFMVSNSDTPLVRALYKGYHIETVSARRMVSCKAKTRGKEQELIIRNYPDYAMER